MTKNREIEPPSAEQIGSSSILMDIYFLKLHYQTLFTKIEEEPNLCAFLRLFLFFPILGRKEVIFQYFFTVFLDISSSLAIILLLYPSICNCLVFERCDVSQFIVIFTHALHLVKLNIILNFYDWWRILHCFYCIY